MPSGIAEVLAACMEPVEEYEKVLGVVQAFTGHDPAKVRQGLIEKCREVTGVDQVWLTSDIEAGTRRLGWGPTKYLLLQLDKIDIEWVMRQNYDRVKGMVARNNDRRTIIKAIEQPEMVEIDMMLKQYVELTHRLGSVMAFGTKLFWDKDTIQSAYGLGWTVPQRYPF